MPGWNSLRLRPINATEVENIEKEKKKKTKKKEKRNEIWERTE